VIPWLLTKGRHMTLSTIPKPNPQLQLPGAGLPWWELLAARWIVFPSACRRLDWEGAGRLFQSEGANILVLWDGIPAEKRSERVLIQRIAGIEDSSRYWSIAMTVEHLNIVGTGVRQIISALRQGQRLDRVARVEDVKPRGEQPPEQVKAEFVRLLADAATAEASEPGIARGVGPRFGHPWFGPLDAFQWHCLLGLHQRIHRKQVEAIRARLP
jgi:hypothetical protein